MQTRTPPCRAGGLASFCALAAAGTLTALTALTALNALTAVTAFAAPDPADPLGPALDAYVRPLVESGHFAGQVLIARNGQVIVERSYGLANRELGVPVTPETRFCIASITKPITVILAIQLIEEGKLGYSDTLSKWIPDYPNGGRITIEHLLRHQAGIPHRVTDDSNESTPRTAADMVLLAARATPLYEPGTGSTYSSAGFSVLARVLELASGQEYRTLLKTRLLDSLGMKQTSDPTAAEILPGRAPSYVPGSQGIENAPPRDLSFLVGAGSVFSTARDLHTLMMAVVSGRMGEGPRQSFLRNGRLNWNGSTNGYRAYAEYDSASGVAVTFAGNVHSGANDLVRQAIQSLVRGEKPAPPVLPAAAVNPRRNRAKVAAATLKGFEGIYQLGNGTRLDVRAKDGMLAANEWMLVPTSDSTFFSPRDFAEVRPIPGTDGKIARLDWKLGADVWPAPRVGD